MRASWHRIARQSVELQVDNESAARELHAELSSSFGAILAPAIDGVLDAACPPDRTLRIDRLEIDLGVVPRDRLLEALAIGARDQLAVLLGSPGDPGTLGQPLASVATWISEDEKAFERVATFLEHGAMTWRDAGFSRASLEESLLTLIERAPVALAERLRRLPPLQAARRIRTQLSTGARQRLLEWLGVVDAARVEQTLAEWTAVLMRSAAAGGASSTHASHRDAADRLFESLWAAAMRGSSRVSSLDVISEAAFSSVTPRRGDVAPIEPVAAILRAAEACLSNESRVRQFVALRAMRLLDPRRRDVALSQDGSLSDHPDTRPATSTARSEVNTIDGPAAPAEAGPRSADGTAEMSTSTARRGPAADADHGPQPDTRARTHTPFTTDPLWAANAGVVVLWPFLPGFFDECGLMREKRFVDAAARARAVLLTAHLADGGTAWGEQELLLAKLLCAHLADEPVESSFELRDEERAAAAELLASAIGHWQALKKTSVDGLREAFLRRDGTLTAITSGWKLEIARTGYDVLLDALPWGIGLVLLPWMEQPLHVEW